ncbi:hypothetical protein Cgig2_010087 [Carnegiea gigantea]|uniref:Uncharacterized protein n=1 Tax=Carnegiea gigantea TaxID=171969 RepID=A0A9Q1QCN8_9CARY|nr:hypothetical protein Cgig2_010087 [Carnegiea gigantea]
MYLPLELDDRVGSDLIARFWVKAYDVPGKKQTIFFAQLLASKMGDFVSCDKATMVGKDISKPLRRGIYVKIVDKQLWIKFKYVKLPDFCFKSGKLGHTLLRYDLVQTDETNANLQYGLEEKQLFLVCKNKAPYPNARVKLVYENSTFIDKPVQYPSSITGGSSDLIMDMKNMIQPSPEVSKRKPDDS